MLILGIHPGYHDAVAVVFDDYRMVAAVQLERPINTLDECTQTLADDRIDYVVTERGIYARGGHSDG